MSDLPWLVVHGAWLWRGALVALLGGLPLTAWLRPRWRARRDQRRAARDFGEAVRLSSKLDGREVTLIGQLCADGSCQRFEDGAEAAAARVEVSRASADARAPGLTLEVDGTQVTLEGPLAVCSGSLEYRPGRGKLWVPAIRERFLKAHGVNPDRRTLNRRSLFRSLRDGDRVLARGTLHVAPGETADYRSEAVRYALRDASLASWRAPRVRGPAPLRLLQAVLVGGIVFLCVFGAAGALLSNAALNERLRGDSRVPLSRVWQRHRALVWLAAMPFDRADALDRLAWAVSYEGRRESATIEARIALDDLQGDCEGALSIMLTHREFRRVLSSHPACAGMRANEMRAEAALAIGDLQRTERALPPRMPTRWLSVDDWDLLLRVQLLAGDFARASANAERAARSLRNANSARSTDYDCLASALAVRAGDQRALARLQALTHKHSSVACGLLLADLQSGDARQRTLARLGDTTGALQTCATLLGAEHDPVGSAARLLALRPDGRFDPWGQVSFSVATLNPVFSGLAQNFFRSGLEIALLDALDKSASLPQPARKLRESLRARAAVESSLLLHPHAALRWAALAEDDSDSDSSAYDACDLAALKADIELRAGDLEAARAAEKTPCDDRFSVQEIVTDIEQHRVPGFLHMADQRGLAAALRGDPRPFVHSLQSAPDTPDDSLGSLAALAHWLPAELDADYLHYEGPFGRRLEADRSELSFLADLALLADGGKDVELSKELRTGIRALRAALQRRDIAVPFAVLQAER